MPIVSAMSSRRTGRKAAGRFKVELSALALSLSPWLRHFCQVAFHDELPVRLSPTQTVAQRLNLGGEQTQARNSETLSVAGLFALALAIRAAIAFKGGLWPDEAFLLSVVEMPSWSEMIRFLHFHESHPPFFYAVVRIWISLTGTSDTTILLLPVFLGAGLVPVTYLVARSFFSPRAGFFAAALTAVASGLAEYSAQLRPYCLLPMLVLLSCTFMVQAIERRGWKSWTGYVICTELLIWTHNWTWLVLAGQGVAAIVVLLRHSTGATLSNGLKLMLAWLTVGLAFLPWSDALFFQIAHAGHYPLPIHGWGDRLEILLFAGLLAPQMILLGSMPKHWTSMMLTGSASAFIAALIGGALIVRPSALPNLTFFQTAASGKRNRSAATVFLVVPGTSLLLAAVLAPRTNLLIGWCLGMLAPLVLIAFASWVDRHWNLRPIPDKLGPLAMAFIAFLLTSFAFGLYWTLESPRSNSREAAAAVERGMRPTDLLIVAPEWYAPAFNHYFKGSIEQTDYPHDGVIRLVDFSEIWTRNVYPAALARLKQRVLDARRNGRRVWLMSGPQYLRALTQDEIADAEKADAPNPMLTLRINEIRDALIESYGQPDTSVLENGPKPRYHRAILELYSADGPAVERPGLIR